MAAADKKHAKKPTPAQARGELARRKGFDWGDGNKVHSIPKSEHEAREAARGAGFDPSRSLTGPLSTSQAFGMATAMANAEYGPQLRANQQLQANTPAWYQSYVDRTTAAQAAQQALAQPILDTAQAAVQNAGQTAPGLDPNSPQYAKEQQAAQGRQTMSQDSANYLAGIPLATNGYLAGQQSIAARELPQVQAGLVQQRAGIESDRGAKATGYFGDIRTGEINADLARRTLLGNQATDAAQIDISRGVDPVTGKPLPAEPLSPSERKTQAELDFFNANGYWPPTGPPATSDAGEDGLTPYQRAQARDKEKKRVSGVRAKSGDFASRIEDGMGDWERFRARKTVKTGKVTETKGKDGTKVETPEKRDVTPADIREWMRDAGYSPQEIHIVLLRRVGKPLDQAAIDYMHRKDFRIPREWLPSKTVVGTVKAPGANGQSRPT